MAISVNGTLNLAINARSVGPAISSIEKEFANKKIGLQVELQIPKGIDREIYRVSNAFRTLDDRMRSLDFSSKSALSGIDEFIKRISSRSSVLGKDLIPAAKSLDQTAKAITSVAKTSKNAKEETASLAEAVGISAKRFASFAIAAGAIANVVFQFQKGFDSALQFDRELVRLKQVGGDSKTTLDSLADRITNLSKTLGVSSSELIKSATTLRQAGLSASDTKIALEALAKTTLAPTFDSIGNTTEGLIAILAQFGQGATALEGQLGSINRVAADFAVESGDLVEAIKRTGGAFVSAGGNLEELLALFTSVRSTTRESAESIATAFRTIFARLQRPETIKNLKDIGIQLDDLEGRFVGPYEAVRRLNEGLANLPTSSKQFAKIVEEIGGVRQLSKVIPLIQQFPIAVKAYNSAIEGQQSLSRDAAIAQESLINKINQLKESFLELFRVVVSNDVFRVLLESAIALTKGLTDLVAAFKPLVPLLVGFSAIKIGTALAGAGPAFRAGFNRRGFASGGIVPPTPNTGIRSGTDTVPALLTEGEYVINKSSAKAIGYDVLNELNTYSTGGAVFVNKYNTGGDVVDVDNFYSKVRVFNNGGNVPTTPSVSIRSGTDTVPALLTKGEYVIKKSAAQAIGYDTLDQLNQYEKGGRASLAIGQSDTPRFANGGSVSITNANSVISQSLNRSANIKTFDRGGFASILPDEKDVAIENVLPKGGLIQNIKNSRKAAMLALTTRSGDVSKQVTIVVPRGKIKQDIAETLPRDVGAVKADFTVAGPSQKFETEILNQTFKRSIKGAISSIAQQAFNTKIPEIDDSIYDKVIDKSGQGRIFEAVLQAIGKYKVEANNQAFDFPEGVKGRLADIFPGAAGKIGDAKLADNTNSQISMVSKMLRSPQFGLGGKTKSTYESFQDKAEKTYEKTVLANPFTIQGLTRQQGREKIKGLTGLTVVSQPNPPKSRKMFGMARGGVVGGTRGSGIRMTGGGMMAMGHAKGGKILGFADGGKVPSGFGSVGGGGYIRPKVVGTNFPSNFNLNKIIADIGLQLSNFVKKLEFKSEEYQIAGRNVSGHFSPKAQSVTAVSGQIPTVLHEVGHAVDFSGTSGPQLSEGNVNPLIQSALKAYISASGKGGLFENQRLIGQGALSNYKPEKFNREAFADLFAGHAIQTGIKTGNISEKDLPASTQKFLSNSNVQKLLDLFGKGLSQATNTLQKVKSTSGYSVAASELASSGNAGIPPTKPPVAAAGGPPEPPDDPQKRKDRTTKLLEEGLQREKAAKTETISTKAVQNVLIDKEAIKTRQAEREEITKNAGLSGQTRKKVNPFAAEEQLGQTVGKFLTNDEYIKAIEEDAKNIAKAKVKAKKAIEDLGADLEVGILRLEEHGSKVRARVKTEDGQVRVFESQNNYRKPKLVQNRIDKLKDRGFNAQDLLAGRGGFNEVTFDDNQPTGRFGKTKSFVKQNFGLIAGGALFAAPAIQQSITGTAEKPGSFGQTGAKVGAGLTGAIEGAGLGASLGSFAGPFGAAIGGAIGAIAGLTTSLNSFASEVDKIAKDKLAKAFGNLPIDPKTGKVTSETALSEVSTAFAGIKDIGLVFDQNKFNTEKITEESSTNSVIDAIRNYDFGNAIFAGLKQIGLGDKNTSAVAGLVAPETTEDRQTQAKASINEFSNQLQDIIRKGIDANPNRSFESFKTFGPKLFNNNTAFQILEKSGDKDSINKLKEYFDEVKKATTIQRKFALAQAEATKNLTDLGTALETLNTSFELAGERFQKNTNRSNLQSEALSGKISAGVSAPGLALFGQFGKNLEAFAKPGGQLDQLRPTISQAIDVGLSNALPQSEVSQQGKDLAKILRLKNPSDVIDTTRALSGPQSEEQSLASGDLAEKFLKDKIPSNNPFASGIIDVVKNTLLKNFGNTEKIPTEDLRSKLTEEVVGQFKNLQQSRANANKQLESVFQSFNQQIGSFAERRASVLQKGVDFQNRAEDFTFQNNLLREEAAGEPTRFTPRGPISSREIVAQEEIQKTTRQRANQLASFGIQINPAEEDFAPGILKARLNAAQKDLSTAANQQETAKQTGDLQGFQDATKKITDLSFTILNLKKGMDLLANSTTVLEAKNKALSVAADKFKSDLAGRKSDAEILTFGTQEEKQRLFQKEQLTQAVTNNPQALRFLNDEQKQLVRERLNESDIGRTFVQTDRFGRERGLGVATSSQTKDFLIQNNFNALRNNPATALLGQNFDRAQREVGIEQQRLNDAGQKVQQVERGDLSSQRKAIEENFGKYITDLTATFNNNSEVFKDFAGAANNLANVLATNPIPNEIILKNNSNINVNLNNANIGNTLTNEAKNAIREEIRIALTNNGVITDKTPARN